MKAGGTNEGDFRELSGSLASAFPPERFLLSPFFCSTIFFLPRQVQPRHPYALLAVHVCGCAPKMSVECTSLHSRAVPSGAALLFIKLTKIKNERQVWGGRIPPARVNMYYTASLLKKLR